MEFGHVKCAPAEFPLTAKRYHEGEPVVSTWVSEHVAAVGLFVSSSADRSVDVVATVARRGLRLRHGLCRCHYRKQPVGTWLAAHSPAELATAKVEQQLFQLLASALHARFRAR